MTPPPWRAFGAVAAATGALVAAGCEAADPGPARPSPTGEAIEVDGGLATPYGRGPGRVWLLTPTETDVDSVVLYLHGWGARLPFEWHLVWLEHLLARGSAVVFPEYQDGVDDAWIVTPYDLQDGARLGFAALDEPDVPVVVAGFSVGATLAFVYAANAERWGVPAPRAAFAIFPVDPFLIDPTLDLSHLRELRAVLLVGDRDDTAGRHGADALAAMLSSLPAGMLQYRVVRTTARLLADHEAPTYIDDPDVRDAFWRPLDELIDDAR